MVYPVLENDLNVVYYGDSDLLGQIASELALNPQSCFAQNVLAWYNSLYSEVPPLDSCDYQVRINQDLCECDPGDTVEDAVSALLAIVEGRTRRAATLIIRIACREALRGVTEGTSSEV